RGGGVADHAAGEGIERIGHLGGGRLVVEVAPEGGPEGAAAAADHHRGAGVAEARTDGPGGRGDGIVGGDFGRADEVQPVRRETRPQPLEQRLHTLTSSALLAYLSRSAPTTH